MTAFADKLRLSWKPTLVTATHVHTHTHTHPVRIAAPPSDAATPATAADLALTAELLSEDEDEHHQQADSFDELPPHTFTLLHSTDLT